tara:strand:+ start:1072 stop:1497 length:426 start_codon:yes stop_codon:yes gene_type:complete
MGNEILERFDVLHMHNEVRNSDRWILTQIREKEERRLEIEKILLDRLFCDHVVPKRLRPLFEHYRVVRDLLINGSSVKEVYLNLSRRLPHDYTTVEHLTADLDLAKDAWRKNIEAVLGEQERSISYHTVMLTVTLCRPGKH